MKKLLLILLFLPLLFSSCTDNYEEGKKLYNEGINTNSKTLLDKAFYKFSNVPYSHKDYKTAQLLLKSLDSLETNRLYQLYIKQKQEESLIVEIEENKKDKEKKKANKNRPLKKSAIGKNIFDYTQNNNYGTPETIDGLTDNKYWVVYYRDVDVTLVSLKANDDIQDACFGREPRLRKGWN